MAGMREKYGNGVNGLPHWLRLVLSGVVLAPSGYFVVVTVIALAKQSPLLAAATFAFAVLFGAPCYLLLPALWQPTEESVRGDWHDASVERRLAFELREDALGHVAPIEGGSRPPSRW